MKKKSLIIRSMWQFDDTTVTNRQVCGFLTWKSNVLTCESDYTIKMWDEKLSSIIHDLSPATSSMRCFIEVDDEIWGVLGSAIIIYNIK